MKRILYFLLGFLGFVSILCSVAATAVVNESLILQGFQQFAHTEQMNVSAQRYGDYAHALSQYLDGKTDVLQVKNPETGDMENAFSDQENLHMRDVKRIVTALKIVRYAGGGLVIAVLGFLYFQRKNQRPKLLSDAARGFAMAAIVLLAAAAALLIWGLVNFTGLFLAFHQVIFSNDLWLLDPNTSLLVSLMPEAFFSWYAVQALKSLWPVLGMMLLVVFVWLRITRIAEKEADDIQQSKQKETR